MIVLRVIFLVIRLLSARPRTSAVFLEMTILRFLMFSMTCSAGAGQGQKRFFVFVVVVVTFVGLFVHLYFAMLRYNCKWFYSPVIDFLPVW